MEKLEIETMIKNNLEEKYPEFSNFEITRMTTSKKHGPSVIYFRALADTKDADFYGAELDEDGNYVSKKVEIRGTKNGDYFTSKIFDGVEEENEDESGNLFSY